MSKTSASSWIHAVFREFGVMLLALILAALPFAATAEAQTANANAPLWGTLAGGPYGVVESAGAPTAHAG